MFRGIGLKLDMRIGDCPKAKGYIFKVTPSKVRDSSEDNLIRIKIMVSKFDRENC